VTQKAEACLDPHFYLTPSLQSTENSSAFGEGLVVVRHAPAVCERANPISTSLVTTGRRRDRLVYFRLSEDEFEQVLKACDLKGARSVSELARSAVREFIKDEQTDGVEQIMKTVKTLQVLVEEMNGSVQELLSTVRPATQPAAESVKAITFTAGGQDT
jgi:hypothetical protein